MADETAGRKAKKGQEGRPDERVDAEKAADSSGATPDNAALDTRTGRDRRAAERVLVDIEVDYGSEDTFLFAYITDISAMGIFVLTNNPEPPGTRLNLRFRLAPGEPSLEVEGLVIWINHFRPGQADNINPGMGIQFVDLSAQQREQVLQLVRKFAYLEDEDGAPRGTS
jgi:type IV pilus assembly protein PilZ